VGRGLTHALRSPSIGGTWRTKGGGNSDRAWPRVELARVAVPREESCPWTICVGPPQRSNADGASCEISRAYIELSWGNAFTGHLAEIDLRQGWQVGVCGATVQVIGVYPEALPPVVTGGELLDWPCTIAPGPTATPHRLTRTRYLGDIAGGNSVWAQVPPFAYAFYVMCRCAQTPATPSYTLEFRDRTAAPWTPLGDASAGNSAFRNRLDHGWQVPAVIPPGAIEVRYTNNDAIDHDDCKLIFELAL